MNTTTFGASNVTAGLFITAGTNYLATEPLQTTATSGGEGLDLDPSFLYLEFVYFKFVQLAYVPVTSLGVLGNPLSLWVWQAETSYNPTVLMLKVGLSLSLSLCLCL